MLQALDWFTFFSVWMFHNSGNIFILYKGITWICFFRSFEHFQTEIIHVLTIPLANFTSLFRHTYKQELKKVKNLSEKKNLKAVVEPILVKYQQSTKYLQNCSKLDFSKISTVY